MPPLELLLQLKTIYLSYIYRITSWYGTYVSLSNKQTNKQTTQHTQHARDASRKERNAQTNNHSSDTRLSYDCSNSRIIIVRSLLFILYNAWPHSGLFWYHCPCLLLQSAFQHNLGNWLMCVLYNLCFQCTAVRK